MIADRFALFGLGKYATLRSHVMSPTSTNHLPFPEAQASDAVVDGVRTRLSHRLAQRYHLSHLRPRTPTASEESFPLPWPHAPRDDGHPLPPRPAHPGPSKKFVPRAECFTSPPVAGMHKVTYKTVRRWHASGTGVVDKNHVTVSAFRKSVSQFAKFQSQLRGRGR